MCPRTTSTAPSNPELSLTKPGLQQLGVKTTIILTITITSTESTTTTKTVIIAITTGITTNIYNNIFPVWD
jgi:hypothetical protein